VLHDIADQLPPVSTPPHVIRRHPGRPTLWFNADCRAQRRKCRRLERRYRRTRSPDDRRLWVEATRRRFVIYRANKEHYGPVDWQSAVARRRDYGAPLSLLGRQCDVTGSTGHIADGFAYFS